MGLSQRAFGPAHRVLVGRTDERAWTSLAPATGRHHRDVLDHCLCVFRLLGIGAGRWLRLPSTAGEGDGFNASGDENITN